MDVDEKGSTASVRVKERKKKWRTKRRREGERGEQWQRTEERRMSNEGEADGVFIRRTTKREGHAALCRKGLRSDSASQEPFPFDAPLIYPNVMSSVHTLNSYALFNGHHRHSVERQRQKRTSSRAPRIRNAQTGTG